MSGITVVLLVAACMFLYDFHQRDFTGMYVWTKLMAALWPLGALVAAFLVEVL